MQDAYLPQRLVDKLMYMYNYIEMARVTGVPMSFLLTRGQSIKVFSQILRKARQKDLLVPYLKVCLLPLQKVPSGLHQGKTFHCNSTVTPPFFTASQANSLPQPLQGNCMCLQPAGSTACLPDSLNCSTLNALKLQSLADNTNKHEG